MFLLECSNFTPADLAWSRRSQNEKASQLASSTPSPLLSNHTSGLPGLIDLSAPGYSFGLVVGGEFVSLIETHCDIFHGLFPQHLHGSWSRPSTRPHPTRHLRRGLLRDERRGVHDQRHVGQEHRQQGGENEGQTDHLRPSLHV